MQKWLLRCRKWLEDDDKYSSARTMAAIYVFRAVMALQAPAPKRNATSEKRGNSSEQRRPSQAGYLRPAADAACPAPRPRLSPLSSASLHMRSPCARARRPARAPPYPLLRGARRAVAAPTGIARGACHPAARGSATERGCGFGGPSHSGPFQAACAPAVALAAFPCIPFRRSPRPTFGRLSLYPELSTHGSFPRSSHASRVPVTRDAIATQTLDPDSFSPAPCRCHVAARRAT